MSQPKDKARPQQRRVTLEVPKDLQGVYSNATLINANSPSEIFIDFVQMVPGLTKAQVVSRIVMSPMHAKMLQRALGQNIAQFEQKHGEIKVPKQKSIADEFFRFPSKPGDDKDTKGE